MLEKELVPGKIGKTLPIQQKAGPSSLPGDDIFWKSFSQLSGANQGITRPYAQSVWVYASVKKIATNISGVPFKIYTPGTDEEKVEVTEGELVDLFNNPNPNLTSEQLWEGTQTYLDLRGESFWIIERNNIAQVPEMIIVADPYRMEPAFNKERTELIGWAYNTGTRKIPFLPHEIVHFKYFNPDDPLRGIAPYQSISIIADQDYFANIYNRVFFKEGAAISGFVEVERGLTDIQFSRLMNQVNDRHQGVTKAHRIGLLENGAKFKETKLSQKDMDFIESKKMSKKEIFTAYGTNDVVLGFFEDVKSFEGMKTAMKAFWEGTLIPRMKYLQGAVNSKFFSFIGDSRTFGEFDLSEVSALKEDYSDKIKNGKELFEIGYSINAINKRLDLGMEDVPWGNVGYLPANLIPAGSVQVAEGNQGQEEQEAKTITLNGGKVVASMPAKFKDIQVKENKPKLIESKQDELEDRVPTKEELDIWNNFLKAQSPVEKKFKSKVRRYFMEQRVRVLANLNDYFKRDTPPTKEGDLLQRTLKDGVLTKGLTDDIFDSEKELKEAKKAFLPLYELGLKVGADMIADELDVSFAFDPLDPSFLQYSEFRITQITPEMLSTVENALRATLTDGIASGETVVQLSDRVKDVYNFSINRSITIARTESASMINAGRNQNMINHGINETEWFTAIDDKVRDTHRALHKSVAKIGDKFRYVNGVLTGSYSDLRYPTDMSAPAAEVVNCRCIALAVIK